MTSENSLGNAGDLSQAQLPAAHAVAASNGSPSADAAVITAQRERWARIPQGLRERDQWTLAGAGKHPLTSSGYFAKCTDPRTWCDFETACKVAIERHLDVGYMLAKDDPFTCIDLDFVDASTQTAKGQKIDPTKWTTQDQWNRFLKIAQSFDSYTEWSRSGKGMHIWVEGNIGRGRRRDCVEIYSQERFIICTGSTINSNPIAPRHGLLNLLLAELERGTQIEVELEDVDDGIADWYLARTAYEDTGELGRLFRSEWSALTESYPSASEADLALVKMLCRSSLSNSQVWSAFQMSLLGKRIKDGRVKSQRHDYMQKTLAVARTHLANDALHVARGKQMADALFWKVGTPTSFNDPKRYQLLHDGDLRNIPLPRWMVKGVIPDKGVGSIYGPSGSFKSFVALDLLAHVSNGRDWFAHRVNAAPAVYVPFEGKGGIPKRVRAWADSMSRLTQQPTSTNIGFILEPMNLRLAADRDKLVATLVERGWAGGLLCIDTLAQSAPGIEENSSEGMGEMVGIFNELQQRLGGVVLVIHHTGKDTSLGMRGWSGLHAAMDFTIECQLGSVKFAGQFVLKKVKDDEDGKTFKFVMFQVDLGTDEDGDPVSSLVVAPPVTHTLLEPETTITDAERDAEDETFIYEWTRKMIEGGEYPSANSLQNQLGRMKEQRSLTQARVRGAIHRLRAKSLVVDAVDKSPSGNKWLRVVSMPT